MTTRTRGLGSAILLATALALGALSGTAQAATPVGNPATQSVALAAYPAQSTEYQIGFRDGYRAGRLDGQKDAEADCVFRGGKPEQNTFQPSDRDQGFADGYNKGYEIGFKDVGCDEKKDEDKHDDDKGDKGGKGGH